MTACCFCPHCGYELRGKTAQLVVNAMEQHIAERHEPIIKLSDDQRWTVAPSGTKH